MWLYLVLLTCPSSVGGVDMAPTSGRRQHFGEDGQCKQQLQEGHPAGGDTPAVHAAPVLQEAPASASAAAVEAPHSAATGGSPAVCVLGACLAPVQWCGMAC